MADSSAPAPAEAASEAPTSTAPARRWPLAGVVAGGVVLSAAVHIALVGTVLIFGARGRGPDPVKSPVPAYSHFSMKISSSVTNPACS